MASSALAPLRYRAHPLALVGGSSFPFFLRSRHPPEHAPPSGSSLPLGAALPPFPRGSVCLVRPRRLAPLTGVLLGPLAAMLRSRSPVGSDGAYVCALLAACGRSVPPVRVPPPSPSEFLPCRAPPFGPLWRRADDD